MYLLKRDGMALSRGSGTRAMNGPDREARAKEPAFRRRGQYLGALVLESAHRARRLVKIDWRLQPSADIVGEPHGQRDESQNMGRTSAHLTVETPIKNADDIEPAEWTRAILKTLSEAGEGALTLRDIEAGVGKLVPATGTPPIRHEIDLLIRHRFAAREAGRQAVRLTADGETLAGIYEESGSAESRPIT